MEKSKAQSGLEYLLLIGGALVIAGVVVIFLFNFMQPGRGAAEESFAGVCGMVPVIGPDLLRNGGFENSSNCWFLQLWVLSPQGYFIPNASIERYKYAEIADCPTAPAPMGSGKCLHLFSSLPANQVITLTQTQNLNLEDDHYYIVSARGLGRLQTGAPAGGSLPLNSNAWNGLRVELTEEWKGFLGASHEAEHPDGTACVPASAPQEIFSSILFLNSDGSETRCWIKYDEHKTGGTWNLCNPSNLIDVRITWSPFAGNTQDAWLDTVSVTDAGTAVPSVPRCVECYPSGSNGVCMWA